MGAELPAGTALYFHPEESFTCVPAATGVRYHEVGGVLPAEELVRFDRIVEM